MAEDQAEENFRFRQFLKHHPRLSSKAVDGLVSELTAKVWKRIDCTTCGNCCREVRPTLSQNDLGRLAQHLGMNSAEFTAKYLETAKSEENPWIMRDCPCPFLKDNRCTVYESRPSNCRDYPYLHKPDLSARTLSMIDRLPVCPAVYEVWEELKQATGFRRSSG